MIIEPPFIDKFQIYCHGIPKNTFTESVKAFAGSFTVTTLLTGNIICGAVHGTLAFLATNIYGFVTPLFNAISENPTKLSWSLEVVRVSIALTGTALAGAAAGYTIALKGLSGRIMFYAIYSIFTFGSTPHDRRSLERTHFVVW